LLLGHDNYGNIGNRGSLVILYQLFNGYFSHLRRRLRLPDFSLQPGTEP
jgi:hypothetical protein